MQDHAGADPEILKSGGALYRPPWFADEENIRFQMVGKGQNNVRNYKFLSKYFYQHFQFSSFLYTLKVCQWNIINFSKFAYALIRKEKKHVCSGQWEKNWGNWTLYYNMIINHFFYFTSSFAAQVLLFDIRMTEDISKGEVGNGK